MIEELEALRKYGEEEAMSRVRGLSPASPTWEIIRDVVQGEADREANLNARGAAVASVAAIVVAIFGAIVEGALSPDWTRSPSSTAAVVVFLLAIIAVTAAMLVAVLHVLRPLRGPSTKMFPSERLIRLWEGDEPLTDDAIGRTYIASSLVTLPEWHFRNRLKARWLRRAYVLLGFGITLIAVGIALILDARAVLDLRWSGVVLLVASGAFWIALRYDLFYAGWRARRHRRDRGAAPVRLRG